MCEKTKVAVFKGIIKSMSAEALFRSDILKIKLFEKVTFSGALINNLKKTLEHAIL